MLDKQDAGRFNYDAIKYSPLDAGTSQSCWFNKRASHLKVGVFGFIGGWDNELWSWCCKCEDGMVGVLCPAIG